MCEKKLKANMAEELIMSQENRALISALLVVLGPPESRISDRADILGLTTDCGATRSGVAG